MLQRFFILAAGVLLFIVAFITYFQVSHVQMEHRFRAERQKFGVDGVVLTAADPTPIPPTSAAMPAPNPLIGPVPPAPATNDASASPDTNAAPTAAADTNAAPAAGDTNSAPTDTNTAPAPAAAPDSNAAPATPASPDSNAAPAVPAAPSSTMDSIGRSSVFQLASYHPSEVAIRFLGAEVTQVTPPPAATSNAPAAAAPTPTATEAPSAVTPAPAASTSAIPALPARQEGKVIVLLYHQFKAAGVPIPAKFQWTMNVDVFESEMKYIHDNGYHVVPMSDLLKFLRHEISLPSNSVCITIDDGYKSAIVYAAPILKKYGYPWTFFIYPQFITTAEGPGAASWNDLLQLQAEGVDIESHSMTHPQLPRRGNKTPEQYAAWLNNETAGSKAILEQKMGKKIVCFAYPYGAYNKQVEAATIAAGYEAIFTVADNPVHPNTDMHSIGRYTITQGVEKNFAAYLRQGALTLATAEPAPGATISNPRPIITATLDYPGKLDPKSIETQVRDFGDVRHDFDPQTNTLRLYLQRDLIAPVVLVNIRARDAVSGQVQVANWHFNYAPEGANAIHTPIAPASKATVATTNAPTAAEPEPMEKNATGTPLDAHPVPATTPGPATASHQSD